MRPLNIGYVSPRERTPAHYTTLVSLFETLSYQLFYLLVRLKDVRPVQSSDAIKVQARRRASTNEKGLWHG